MAEKRLIVVKVGSAVLAPDGKLDPERLTLLALDIAGVTRKDCEVVLVSSGAVAAGLHGVGLTKRPTAIVMKQAAAAVGQSRMVGAWSRAFEPFGLSVAQVLLTPDVLDDRGRFLNARRTLETLLDHGVIPMVNENDTVSFDRLHFGDNDRLAAMVTSLLDADLLILLSVVNGVLDESGATVHVAENRDHIRSLVRDEKSSTGVGGMMSKLDSAEFAMSAGADVVIASGLTQGVVGKVVDGKKVGTRFAARPSASARKRWLATARPRGALVVDAGAAKALQGGASLLPAGITQIKGSFESGSIVAIEGDDGLELARGLASYSSSEMDRIKGRHSDEIERVLGFVYSPEAVHREDLYMHYEPGGDL